MLKKGSSSQPVPMRQRRRRISIPCFAGLLLYSLLCIGVLLTLAAEDHDQLVISDQPTIGAEDPFDSCCQRAQAITPASLGAPVGGPVVNQQMERLAGGFDSPRLLAIGARCLSRVKALAWAREQGISAEIIAAINASLDETNIPPAVLLAIGEVESNHNQSCIGDGGRSIGWGQVQRSPWQAYAIKETGRVLSLDILEDNVLISAMVLEYSGYHQDPFTSYARYNGGPAYKCKKAQRYARKVQALVREIEEK